MLQISGFAILIDRRNGTWQDLSSVFYKIISQFPGDIKEVFLLYKYPSGYKVPYIAYCIDCLDEIIDKTFNFEFIKITFVFSSRKANVRPAGRQRLPPRLRHLPRVGRHGAPPLCGWEVSRGRPWGRGYWQRGHVDTDSALRGQVHLEVSF